jgi:hypothetical protein
VEILPRRAVHVLDKLELHADHTIELYRHFAAPNHSMLTIIHTIK